MIYDLRGLNKSEIEISRKKHGPNIISKKKRKGFFSQYLTSFGDPIIKILLIALAVNIIFLFKNSDWYESAGIAIAVVLATFISTISEYGSESAFEKLQKEVGSVKCRVKRNHTLIQIPQTEIVVGDIVLLQAGERIPADGHIVRGHLSVDQSALNGESKETEKYPSEKSHNDVAGTGLLSKSELFQGSVVCDGDGAMIVDKVGNKTFYGNLAIEVQESTIESPLKTRLNSLAKTISILGYTAAIIVAVANLFNIIVIDSHFDYVVVMQKLTNLPFIFSTLIDTITLAITVIVMAAPEGLPMMITVVLSANMKKMLKDNVLVRKLVGIETSGSLNILFTDKTGTLTKGHLEVVSVLNGQCTQYDTFDKLKQAAPLFNSIIFGCLYNTDSSFSGTKIIGGNSTDRALLEYAQPFKNKYKNIITVSHEPFSSKKKMSTSHIIINGRHIYLYKGAPELILPRCKYYLDETGTKKTLFTGSLYTAMRQMAEKAIRMIAIAQSDSSSEYGLTLAGILCLRDEIRKESRGAVRQIEKAGIQTVMITGDNRETAAAIGKEIGLLKNGNIKNAILTSQDLMKMSDSEIKSVLKNIRIVARAMPSDKSRLVKLAQNAGLVVGMTGDGVNDAPALKRADVGFAMGTGTEVAKEAGDIVIVDNNIKSIAKSVLYGRTIFKSIRKFIIFQLTMNFCAVSLSVICPFLGIDAPLTVMQMLWVNMIMDTLAGVAFSGEPPLHQYMEEPPKKRDAKIINLYMYSQILFTGLYTSALCIIFLKSKFSQEIFLFGNGTDYFMSAFFSLFIFAGVFNSLNARTYRLKLFEKLSDNKLFIIIMLFVCVVQIILIYSGGTIFRTAPLQWTHLAIIIVMAISVIPADLARKILLRLFGRKGHL